jgi:hypothetical protein
MVIHYVILTCRYNNKSKLQVNTTKNTDTQSISHGDSKSAGVSVMFRNGFDFKVNDSILDQNGRYIILDLTVYEQRLTLVCLYGYNTDKPELVFEKRPLTFIDKICIWLFIMLY